MSLSGGLGDGIRANAELLRHEYGSRYANLYLKLAEKFRIKEVDKFSTGWDNFEAMEKLANTLREKKRSSVLKS